jgi:hypothetical protein
MKDEVTNNLRIILNEELHNKSDWTNASPGNSPTHNNGGTCVFYAMTSGNNEESCFFYAVTSATPEELRFLCDPCGGYITSLFVARFDLGERVSVSE